MNELNKRPTQPDDSYWASLLDQVDSLAPEEVTLHSDNGMEDIEGKYLNSADNDAWIAARDAYEAESTFELTAIGYNKGGILVEWESLSGFIPASQLNDFPHVHLESERVDELKRRQNETMSVKIIEVNQVKNRLIFSERAALVKADERRSLWDEIRPGDKRSGSITNMANFGAFVDLGGVEGLIHISELSWSRLNHPSDVVKPGDEIEAVVLEVDRSAGRVALSMKQMRTDPWIGVEERYKPGQVVSGLVNNVVPFGAFITLEPQLEGLIHISELAEGSFLHPRNVVEKGDMVNAKVINVDPRGRRLALSLRGVEQPDSN